MYKMCSLEATVDQACSRNGEILCKRCYSRFSTFSPMSMKAKKCCQKGSGACLAEQGRRRREA